MAIYANANSSNYEPVPAGTYAARCYSMVHIGTVEEEFQGQKKEMNKVRISWELPTELKVFKEGEPEKPQLVSKEFTLSMHEKATLRKFLESWRGKGFTDEEAKKFDVTKLLGKSCLLSIIHKTSKGGKTYAEISSISTLPKGMTCPDQINANFEFTYEPFSQDKFDKLPDYVKDKVKTSREYKLATEPAHSDVNGSTHEEDDMSDIPF